MSKIVYFSMRGEKIIERKIKKLQVFSLFTIYKKIDKSRF